MWYVIAASAAVIITFALVNRSTAKKLETSVAEAEKLRSELIAVRTESAKKDSDIKKLTEVISELQKVKADQETKAATRKKKEPAPAGDSAARLDRLNN